MLASVVELFTIDLYEQIATVSHVSVRFEAIWAYWGSENYFKSVTFSMISSSKIKIMYLTNNVPDFYSDCGLLRTGYKLYRKRHCYCPTAREPSKQQKKKKRHWVRPCCYKDLYYASMNV